jgi:hypothetical protein
VCDEISQKGHAQDARNDHGIDLPRVAQDHRGLTDILNFEQQEPGSQEKEMPV